MRLPACLKASGIVLAGFLWVGRGAPAGAHPGGLNAEGCHNNRKTGGYHCHRGAAAGPSRALAAVSSGERREFDNCA